MLSNFRTGYYSPRHVLVKLLCIVCTMRPGGRAPPDRRRSRSGPASRPTCCAHGSAATGCSGRRGRRADSGSTRTRTCGGSRRCATTSTQGLSAAQAARLALAGPPSSAAAVDRPAPALVDRLERFDEAGAHAHLDALLGSLTLETVLLQAVLPALATIGDRWERGEVSVAQEHFASALIRGRLLGLARRWGAGAGPHALLACPPGELHDLGLIAFGLALRGQGWRITYLGPDTPIETIADAAAAVDADVVVVAATLHGADRGGACVARSAGDQPARRPRWPRRDGRRRRRDRRGAPGR